MAAVEEKTTDGRGLPMVDVTNEYDVQVRLVFIFPLRSHVVHSCVKQRGERGGVYQACHRRYIVLGPEIELLLAPNHL